MSIGKILKIAGKNALAFLGGAALGAVAVVFIVFPRAMEKVALSKEPLAAVILAPLLLILYGVFGIVAGGFSGIIIYNIIKLILRIKK